MKSQHEIDLKQEHQSRALLVKFVWLLISELCLTYITHERWDREIRSGYVLGTIAIGLLFIAAVGLLIAANAWLRDTPVRLISRWVMADARTWAFGGALLLVSAGVWWSYSNLPAALTSGSLSVIAIITAYFCWLSSKRMSDLANDKGNPLEYVKWGTNAVAVLALLYGFCVVVDSLAHIEAIWAGRTLLAALLGGASGLATLRIGTEPVFSDTVRVFSTPTGTQFVYPSQILITDTLFPQLPAAQLEKLLGDLNCNG